MDAKTIEGHKAKDINKVVNDHLDAQSIVFSDKSSSYVDISKFVHLHITDKSSPQTTNQTLKWVHMTISNAQRVLLGDHHKIKRKYLQNDLDEFCYKLNRRYFGDQLFDRLVIANITALGEIYK